MKGAYGSVWRDERGEENVIIYNLTNFGKLQFDKIKER